MKRAKRAPWRPAYAQRLRMIALVRRRIANAMETMRREVAPELEAMVMRNEGGAPPSPFGLGALVWEVDEL